MNAHQLSRLFPNASRACIAANSEDSGAAAELERTSRDAALRKASAKKADTARFFVRVTSVRKRLLDQDNLAEKYHVDCCRYCGVLPNDNPQQTRIEVTQRKPELNEEEHTLVEVWQTE